MIYHGELAVYIKQNITYVYQYIFMVEWMIFVLWYNYYGLWGFLDHLVQKHCFENNPNGKTVELGVIVMA